MIPPSADRSVTRGLGYVLAITVVLSGAAVGGWVGASLGGLLGLAVLTALGSLASRKARRRQAVVSQAFPEPWREFLRAHSHHYRRLPEDLRRRFETGLQLFLAERRLTGVEVEVTEDVRLLVAASAVTLSVGWPDFEWSALHEVLLYPQSFDETYEFNTAGSYAGMAHPSGTLIVSIPALRESFARPRDGYHVGYHEFAHLLDQEADPRGVEHDGIPVGLPGRAAATWAQLQSRETRRIRHHRSVLRDYGATNAVEFFAVAVETFFELPGELRASHPKLYQFLATYFCQDPAWWEEAAQPATPVPPARDAAGVEKHPGEGLTGTRKPGRRSGSRARVRTPGRIATAVRWLGYVFGTLGFVLALGAVLVVILAAVSGPQLPTVLRWLGMTGPPSEVVLPADLVIIVPARSIGSDVARFSGKWQGTWPRAAAAEEWVPTQLAVVEITAGSRAAEYDARGMYTTRSRLLDWQGTIQGGWLLIERDHLRLRLRVVEEGRLQATALLSMAVVEATGARVRGQVDGTFRPLDR
jgi:Mlc titration factor MtfA (ptsG expression regulator)